jgi:hypothetical protein
VAIAGVGAYPTFASEALRAPLAAVTVAALAVLAVAVIGRWSAFVQLALWLPLAAYAAFLVERGEVDTRAPLVAAGLLVAAELAYAALEPPTTRRAAARSALLVLVGAAGAAALGALLVGAAALGRGTLVEYAFGFAAAAATVALLTWLAWSASRSAGERGGPTSG